jgi:hypothetical protein
VKKLRIPKVGPKLKIKKPHLPSGPHLRTGETNKFQRGLEMMGLGRQRKNY